MFCIFKTPLPCVNMNLRALTLAFFLLSMNVLFAQRFEWAKSFGGSTYDVGYSIAIDHLGNAYTTGYFEGTVDFDPGSGVFNLSSNGRNDVFVQKLDAAGNFLWAKSFGGIHDDVGNSITTDTLGNVYIRGRFKDSVDFDPGLATNVRVATGISSSIFIQKLDANGSFLWVKSIDGYFLGNGIQGEGTLLSLDNYGNVYHLGTFIDTVDFDPGPGTHNLTSGGDAKLFVQKFDANGNFLWVKPFGNSDYQGLNSLSIDVLGNIYTAGSFNDTADFDPGIGISNLISVGASDAFIQKMDFNGNFIWAKSFGATNIDGINSIAVDAFGNVFSTGYYKDTVDFDPGAGISNLISRGLQYNSFIHKIDSNGTFQWAKSFGGFGNDYANSVSIAADNFGNIYTVGTFKGTIDFNPTQGNFFMTSTGWNDVFIHQMDANGNFQKAVLFDGNWFHGISSIVIDDSGNLYTVGTFEGTVDYNPGPAVNNLSSVGSNDVFIQKMTRIGTGIDKINTHFKVLAYPNPSNGIVQIQFKEFEENVTLTLRDVLGKVVSIQEFYAISNTQIDLPDQKGFYFLSIQSNTGQSIIKLVRE